MTKSRISQKKFLCRMISLIALVSLLFSVAVTTASAETNEAVNKVKDSLLQVRLVYKEDPTSLDEGVILQGGTGILFNNNKVLTCKHVVTIEKDSEVDKYLKSQYGDKYKKENIRIQVIVSNDLSRTATIERHSSEMDFAVLNLDGVVNKREIAKLGDSSKISSTDEVYALGFPQAVVELNNKATYRPEDVVVTNGRVSSVKNEENINYIVHNAKLSDGNSGGPLVDADGNIIGINRGQNARDDGYFYSVSINQIKDRFDEFGIEYTPGNSVGVLTTEPASESNNAQESTSAPELQTQAPTVMAQIETPTSSPAEDEEPAEESASKSDTTLIIIIAIVVLVIIIVIIVIVILVGGKKNNNGGGNTIPTVQPPVNNNFSAMGGMNKPQPPQNMNMPPQNINNMPPQVMGMRGSNAAAPTVVSMDGAGETSVLNDGAGETTVLGFQSGPILLRVKNNEKININKPEFTIGRERRKVDYCISDNNSVSRVHTRIKARSGRYYIADLGSANCTYVNGNKLSPNQEVELHKGDKVKVSDEEFEFLG